ncbi:protein-export chaperone SecB [Hymenobacter latericus]|uniref:protein-export chaperone SecB n=1 Tax=Hymenobacter sp. YIM 151858-1 TaxID=2987688 RepID=UPI002227B478|nr:protein-export chaperone SecB [Hymenobacter sp. YIM 151858-1]UYZ57835.1 protein-export chaperone SecB [Hymenobacter sp. YIM 151858-1]
MEQTPAKFSLQGVQIKESLFKQAEEYTGSFKVTTEANGVVRRLDRVFQLHLQVRVFDESGSFEAKVYQVGNFVFDQDIEASSLTNYFVGNAPAMLFPFVRSYIAAVTALSGYSTIIVPALNLVELGKKLRSSIVEEE